MKPMQPMHTLVAIVNYRTADLTIDCLRSLAPEVAAAEREFGGPVRVVVTDNASGDDSPDRIEAALAAEGWADWCELLRLPKNGGFAYGNNEAIRPALESADPPRFAWLLNPDTVVRPGALRELVRFLEEKGPTAGLAGSRLEDPDATVQNSNFRFPCVANELDSALHFGPVTKLLKNRIVYSEPPTTPARCDWVAGASFLVRREVFERVGLLDEGYFMYFEETDFCLQAARAGFECWYVPASRVVHLVGQASGIDSRGRAKKRQPRYWFDSRRRYWLKNLGAARTLAGDATYLAAFAAWRLRRRVQRKADPDPSRFLLDFARHSVFGRGFRI